MQADYENDGSTAVSKDNNPAELAPDTPVWGAKAIAPIINTSVRKAFHLLELGRLDATKNGPQWVSTPRRLRKGLVGEDPKK